MNNDVSVNRPSNRLNYVLIDLWILVFRVFVFIKCVLHNYVSLQYTYSMDEVWYRSTSMINSHLFFWSLKIIYIHFLGYAENVTIFNFSFLNEHSLLVNVTIAIECQFQYWREQFPIFKQSLFLTCTKNFVSIPLIKCWRIFCNCFCHGEGPNLNCYVTIVNLFWR